MLPFLSLHLSPSLYLSLPLSFPLRLHIPVLIPLSSLSLSLFSLSPSLSFSNLSLSHFQSSMFQPVCRIENYDTSLCCFIQN